MEQKASRLSSNIIHAHMMQSDFSLDKASQDTNYTISFYNKIKEPITPNHTLPIDWNKHFSIDNETATLIDQSTFGHLGVEYIVIQQEGIENYLVQLRQKILGILLFSYLIITLVGYVLAKLFIKPIQMKRMSLDNFIKDSTHELNTPITALLLSLNAPNLTTAKNIERIRLSAKRIADIYQDLTYLILNDITKILDTQPICLNERFHNELNYLTLLAEKRQVTIEIIEKSEIYFMIDSESFIRLIHNLITNAIKYNRADGTITILFETNRLTVRDTGVGIPKSKQQEIYQRFYRATDQTGGFGLGLNIVNKICTRYDIGIELESEVGKGTTFILTF